MSPVSDSRFHLLSEGFYGISICQRVVQLILLFCFTIVKANKRIADLKSNTQLVVALLRPG
jgi:hypothetical protein